MSLLASSSLYLLPFVTQLPPTEVFQV